MDLVNHAPEKTPGELVGDRSPHKIKHHLQQLEKRGLLKINRIEGTIERPKAGWIEGFLQKGRRLLQIPIVGVANCGPAEIIFEEPFFTSLRKLKEENWIAFSLASFPVS
jgi:hypothetical protein